MSCRSNPPNCDAWRTRGDHEPPPYGPDADIAGVGVVAAFIISAGLTLVAALIHMILDPPWKKDSKLNVVDDSIYFIAKQKLGLDRALLWIWTYVFILPRYLLSWIFCSIFGGQQSNRANTTRKQWSAVFERMLLSLSDQQLIAGLAMVVAGVALHCSISVYHFSLILDYLWFSSNVHLQCLRSLRFMMRDSPVLRNWRIFLMLAIAIVMAVFQVFTGHQNWMDSWPYHFQCLAEDLIGHVGGTPGMVMKLNLIIIFCRYSVATIFVFRATEDWAVRWIFEQPVRIFNWSRNKFIELRGMRKAISSIVLLPVMVTMGFTVLVAVLVDSDCVTLAFNWIFYGYGIYLISIDRHMNSSHAILAEESQLNFGQIVPLVLLSTTLFTFGETYYNERPAVTDNDVKEENAGLPLQRLGQQGQENEAHETAKTTLQPKKLGHDAEQRGKTFYIKDASRDDPVQ